MSILKELFKKTKFGRALNDIYTYEIVPMSFSESNDLLFKSINSNSVFSCGRLGYSECWGSMHQKKKELFPLFYKYPIESLNFLSINAGMFSTSFGGRHYYKKRLIKSLKTANYISYMDFPLENYMIGTYKNKSALVINWDTLFANKLIKLGNPWTLSLENKKVLVVSAFADTISEQYKIKDKVFSYKQLLPKFHLITYKPPITFALEEHKYKTWKGALGKMCNDISKLDFDIALLSCGSYGMPLQWYIKKKLHKSSIYFGGAIEMLFGIRTKRDEEAYDVKDLYNEYWVRPSEDEKPKNSHLIDEGAYW